MWLLSSTQPRHYVTQTTGTTGEHGFSYSSPAAWNCLVCLPPYVQAMTDTNIFKQHLKIISVHRLILVVLLVLLDQS